jgi:hypothetical protein
VSGVSVYDRVVLWLRERPGQCYCKPCIAKNLNIVGNTNLPSITNSIGATGGSKYMGRCSSCGNVTTVIAVNGGF